MKRELSGIALDACCSLSAWHFGLGAAPLLNWADGSGNRVLPVTSWVTSAQPLAPDLQDPLQPRVSGQMEISACESPSYGRAAFPPGTSGRVGAVEKAPKQVARPAGTQGRSVSPLTAWGRARLLCALAYPPAPEIAFSSKEEEGDGKKYNICAGDKAVGHSSPEPFAVLDLSSRQEAALPLKHHLQCSRASPA